MSEQNDSPFEAVTDENLEARIVAWVLGGASESEAGLLRALCREQPELAMFRRRIEEAHGLLAESMQGPAVERKVPPEGGRKVLEMGGVRAGLSRRGRSVRSLSRRVLVAAAACLLVALVVAGLMVSAGSKGGKRSVQRSPQPNPQAELDRVESEMEGIERALREQQARVEEKRKVLNTIVETKGIVYKGGASIFGGAPVGADEDMIVRSAAMGFEQLEQEKVQLESQIQTLLKYDSDQLIDFAAGLSLPENRVKRLRPDYATAKSQLTDLRASGLGKEHPRVEAQEEIIAEQKEQLNEGVTELRNTLRAQLALTKERLAKMDDLQAARREASVKTGIDTYDFVEAREEYEDARQMHDRLRLELQGRKLALEVKREELEREIGSERGRVPAQGGDTECRVWSADEVVVGGYVRRPGPVRIGNGMTLGKVVEAVAGANEFGAINRMELYRDGKRKVIDLRDEDARALVLKPGDSINVPQKNWLGNGGGRDHADSPAPADRSADHGGRVAAKAAVAKRSTAREDPSGPESAVKRLNQRLAGETLIGSLDAVPVTASTPVVIDSIEARTEFEQAREMFDQMRIKYQGERIQLELPRNPIMCDEAIDLMAELSAGDERFSTFSLHVSDSSFRVAVAALERGERPEPESVRPEEFYNAFDYGDPAPTAGEPVACAIEQCAHPLLPGRNLVRIGVCTAAAGRGAGQVLHLTVLLDSSGSMERGDRRAAVHEALEQLASLLGPQDVVTVVGFARQPRLLADRVSGEEARVELVGLADRTPAEGGTNLEQALALASELALRQFDAAAQNRIVLLTDGAANLGSADPEQLAQQVDELRQRGISFDAAGFGTAGMNDRMLERLTRDGNGRYYVVDGPQDAGDQFAEKLAGAFRPAAENVKVQVRFNPARVGHYRLIGFEEHRLKKEDFRDDSVDAAEMAAEEAGVAIYQVELLPGGEGEIGEVSVRFRDVAGDRMVERNWTMPHDPSAPAFDQASASIQVAGIALLAADSLRDGPLAPLTDWRELAPVSSGLRHAFGGSAKVGQLLRMVERLR